MNNGFWACIVPVPVFLITGTLFAIFKGRAAKFVSGFDTLSPAEQALYDKNAIVRDVRNDCFIWSVILTIGALLALFVAPWMSIAAYGAWLFLLFRGVHLDARKAFEKYLIRSERSVSSGSSLR